ncbi:hypothetical protein [Streptomyces sp. NPDC056190]|uniref:hypothetical protein n=1 Tax=Streptomyces sp. NPDC056190 TaxID=3345741 RepID=UPI0035E08B05
MRAWLHREASAAVWLDARGTVATPPEGRDFAATAGVAVAFATGLGGVVTVYGVWRAIDGGIDRHRLAQWYREWGHVEPGWVARCGR